MALETLSSNDFFSFIISATPFSGHDSSETSLLLLRENRMKCHEHNKPAISAQGRKKRRRKTRICKNKEVAESQRMIHIAVERNRRKQMNEHLAVLRSLMPEAYVQRVCFLFIFPSFFSLLNSEFSSFSIAAYAASILALSSHFAVEKT